MSNTPLTQPQIAQLERLGLKIDTSKLTWIQDSTLKAKLKDLLFTSNEELTYWEQDLIGFVQSLNINKTTAV